jgi:hypothetical protein
VPSRRALAAVVAVAVGILAAGCGSSSGSGSGSTTAAGAATTAAGASTTAPPTTAAPAATTVDTAPPPQGPNAVLDGSPIGDIQCEAQEEVALHIHAGLAIVLDGKRVTIPANVGINVDQQCLYWLHTHVDKGVIHVESPTTQEQFTLGQFFQVWGFPLSQAQVLDFHGALRAWVNGKPFSGDPATIPLRDLETIVISNDDLTGHLPAVDFAEIEPA